MVSKELQEQIKEVIRLSKTIVSNEECSGTCDSYGICMLCALKTDLAEVVSYDLYLDDLGITPAQAQPANYRDCWDTEGPDVPAFPCCDLASRGHRSGCPGKPKVPAA